jgi:hypothetical protein
MYVFVSVILDIDILSSHSIGVFDAFEHICYGCKIVIFIHGCTYVGML